MAQPFVSATVPGCNGQARVGLLTFETRFPIRGGAAVHIYQLWHRLQRMGYEVHTWGEQVIPHARVHPRTHEGLASMLDDVDLLYVRFPFETKSIGKILLLLRRWRVPVVCEFNAPLCEFSHEWPRYTRWALRRRAELYGRNHLLVRALVDHGICVSKVMTRHVRRTYGLRNVSTIPNGGDPDMFSPARRDRGRRTLGLGDDDFAVFWGGSTALAWQGLDALFGAAEHLKRDGVKFIVAGERRHLPEALPENVLAPGARDYFEIPDLMAAADVSLCLYRSYDWCPIGFYGSSLKLFDYLACETAVIASPLGQVADIVKHNVNGLLCDRDGRDVADMIDFLRQHPEKRRAIARAGRQTVISYYNWERVARHTHAIMARLLGLPAASAGNAGR